MQYVWGFLHITIISLSQVLYYRISYHYAPLLFTKVLYIMYPLCTRPVQKLNELFEIRIIAVNSTAIVIIFRVTAFYQIVYISFYLWVITIWMQHISVYVAIFTMSVLHEQQCNEILHETGKNIHRNVWTFEANLWKWCCFSYAVL